MKAISLLIVLLVSRAMASAGHHVAVSWWSPAAYLWHDAIVVLAFAALEVMLRHRPRVVWTLYVIAASYVVLNVPVQRVLWSPLTMTMWRATGGPLADSIRHYATWIHVTAVVAGFATVALAPRVARHLPARAVLVTAVLCAALGPMAAERVDTMGAHRNAWTALAGSIAIRPVAVVEARDWRASSLPAAPDADLRRFRGVAAGRNVVMISLESTAARYLGIYGAQPDVAPNLSALASSSAIVFDNAYAVYPESIKGLFSVLCSSSPAIDTAAESYAAVSCPSIAQTLANERYRTALFHSGRFDYLGMNAIVRNRGFATLADAGDIGGEKESSFGIDEASTIDSLLRWIDQGGGDRPFFVTYLPIAGHHPYESDGQRTFPDDDEFGRYRNALHYGDAALGQLRRGLEARRLDARTLWIVYGDHGEAFGQHEGNYGHTFHLYDENVRVPFVIAAPGAMPGTTRARQVVSLLDTAPTILDLLRLPIPDAYDGRSMLDGRSRAALFFTDYSLSLAGLRDGPRKVIHDLRSGRTRWFDLDADPDERVDLSSRHPAETKRYADTLEGWTRASRSVVPAR